MPTAPLPRLREISLALPEAVEDPEGVGHPSFKVRDKIFAMYMPNHHDDGRVALWCKAAPGDQAALVEGDAERFFIPPYVGRQGWVGVRLDPGDIDWAEIADLVTRSYRLIAPNRLAAAVTL